MIGIPCSLPKISCLMVTADGRLDYFRESFRCYVSQTYKNKELVIVTDAGLEYKDQIASITAGHENIRLVFLTGKYTLGALRNISMAVCEGDIFVQWDDDDFNTPDRLFIQFAYLSKSNKRACYLGDQLHYFFPTQELFWEDWFEHGSNFNIRYGLIPGTLMAYKEGFVARYPSAGQHARAGEDSILSDTLVANEQVILLKGKGNMQVYSYHGRNVWDIEHHRKISIYRSHDISFMNRNREKICETLRFMKFSPTVRVMGREGLAFIFEDDNAN
jgi:glycosyltransferase involved in cell wall biosynthesis